MKKSVAVIGVSGYTGFELVKILINHPYFELKYLATSEGNSKLSEIHKKFSSVFELDIDKVDIQKLGKTVDLIFLALPHKTAMEFVKEFMKFPNLKIVDLSADYRLEQKTYEKHYLKHIDSENLVHSVYGLPELYREQIKQARLVANPGCYPTASILGIVPFVKYLEKGTQIIIDAKSGVSGAGKKCTSSTHYVTINENMFAYNPLTHRHSPEIAEKIKEIGGDNFTIQFIPHLVPVTRGMLASIYLNLKEEIEPIEILKEFYKNEPFIRIRETPVTMKESAETHFCDIFAKNDGKFLYIETSIDNLLRGASSQAVANANLMFGFDEKLGLPLI